MPNKTCFNNFSHFFFGGGRGGKLFENFSQIFRGVSLTLADSGSGAGGRAARLGVLAAGAAELRRSEARRRDAIGLARGASRGAWARNQNSQGTSQKSEIHRPC